MVAIGVRRVVDGVMVDCDHGLHGDDEHRQDRRNGSCRRSWPGERRGGWCGFLNRRPLRMFARRWTLVRGRCVHCVQCGIGGLVRRAIWRHRPTADQIAPGDVDRPARGSIGSAPPRRSPFTAIAWKQFRESGPIVLAGLGGVAMIVVAVASGTLTSQVAHRAKTSRASYPLVLRQHGYFGALIHVGGRHRRVPRDLDAEVQHILAFAAGQSNAWFWIKFATGLAVVCADVSICRCWHSPVACEVGIERTCRRI